MRKSSQVKEDTGEMTSAAGAESRVDRLLSRAIRVTAVLLAFSVVSLAVYWYGQRYTHATVSMVDRDTEIVEGQIRQQPNDPQLRVAVANLYVEKGLYDDAIAQAEQVLQISPDDLSAILALAQAHTKEGKLELAVNYLLRAIELNQDNPMARSSLQLALIYQYLGSTYMEMGRTEDAVGAFRHSLEIDHTNADTLHMLGNALAAQGQIDEAIESYRQALRLVPNFPEVHRDLYRAYERKGDRDLATYAFGMVRYSAGEYDQAVETLEKASQALPEMAETHLGLAMAYEKKGRRSEALEEYRKALALDGGSIAARQGTGRLAGR